jgi:nitrogen fixation NifU-like protein
MSSINDLYQEVILDHNRKPRNFHELANADCRAEGFNPLCGDQITVYVELENDRVSKVSFLGDGCAISRASASIMTDAVKGKTLEEVEALFQKVHKMLTGEKIDTEKMGKLAVFSGVCEFPMRVKCATLAWHTLKAALNGEHDATSTE